MGLCRLVVSDSFVITVTAKPLEVNCSTQGFAQRTSTRDNLHRRTEIRLLLDFTVHFCLEYIVTENFYRQTTITIHSQYIYIYRAFPWRIGLRHGFERKGPGSIPGVNLGLSHNFSLIKRSFSHPRFKTSS